MMPAAYRFAIRLERREVPYTRSSHLALQIGTRVQTRRLECGLSEEVVARAIGCDIDHLQGAEAGKANFTAPNIVDLCSVLRVMPSWFFEEIADLS